jgi:excisionase family DNA binding protein
VTLVTHEKLSLGYKQDGKVYIENEHKDAQKFFDNKILRVEQVAKILGFSKDHIYRLVNQKKIPFRKKGKTLFFMSQEIFDWVNDGVAS